MHAVNASFERLTAYFIVGLQEESKIDNKKNARQSV